VPTWPLPCPLPCPHSLPCPAPIGSVQWPSTNAPRSQHLPLPRLPLPNLFITLNTCMSASSSASLQRGPGDVHPQHKGPSLGRQASSPTRMLWTRHGTRGSRSTWSSWDGQAHSESLISLPAWVPNRQRGRRSWGHAGPCDPRCPAGWPLLGLLTHTHGLMSLSLGAPRLPSSPWRTPGLPSLSLEDVVKPFSGQHLAFCALLTPQMLVDGLNSERLDRGLELEVK
jgi:hypothetical protein